MEQDIETKDNEATDQAKADLGKIQSRENESSGNNATGQTSSGAPPEKKETKPEQTVKNPPARKETKKVASKIVRLILVGNNRQANNYRSRPFMTAPIWSVGKNKYLTGYEDLDQAATKKRELILKINPEEHYPVFHMMKLNLGNKRDEYFLEYLHTQPQIAKSKAEADARSNYYLFFVEDKQREAEVSLTKADEKFEAEMLVRQELAQADYRDLVIWMGADVKLLTDIQLKDYLVGDQGVCKTRSREVIAFFNKTNAEIMFVRKLAFYGVIIKDKKGRGYYDDNRMEIFLGASEAAVTSFMQEKDHKPYLDRWREDLKKYE